MSTREREEREIRDRVVAAAGGKELIDAAQVAALLGLQPATLRRRVNAGVIPLRKCYPHSQRHVYRVQDVVDYLESVGGPPKRRPGRPRKRPLPAEQVGQEPGLADNMPALAPHEVAALRELLLRANKKAPEPPQVPANASEQLTEADALRLKMMVTGAELASARKLGLTEERRQLLLKFFRLSQKLDRARRMSGEG